MKSTMGIDQYGNTYHDLGPQPRKALLEYFGAKTADKIYVDDAESSSSSPNGNPARHIGYIVSGHWVTLFNVTEWSR